MQKNILSKYLIVSLLLLPKLLTAQQNFSLSEAVKFAVKNHVTVKNAQLDILNASARVNEIKAIGLPQVTGNIGLTDNLIISRFFVPAKTFNPAAAEGEVSAVKFGTNFNSNVGINVSQLVFDGSYLLGLKAADVYKEISAKSVTQTKQQVAENVMRAYYSILVNEERLNLLKANIGRLDSLLRDTRGFNKEGFIEKIDVQRLEIQSNNLKTETKNVERLQELSYAFLKFQMSLGQSDIIVLTDKLESINPNEVLPETDAAFKYENRIDYSLVQTQEKLAVLDLKNQKVGYYPNVRFSGNFGSNTGRDAFGDIFSKEWFNNSAITLSVNIPIFDGFAKKYKIVQSQNNLQKIKNSYGLLEQSIDLQRKQADISLKNAWETLQENKANLALAKEIIRVTRIKYQQGVGSNLEVLNAETSLKEAQTNYLSTLYSALVAKVDWDKANGKLVVE